MRPIRQGNPDGVNYHTRCPVAKGARDYFAHDIVRAIHIRVDAPPVCRTIEPALDPSPTEDGCRIGSIVDRQRIPVEEAGLTGVALLGDLHLDAHQLGLVLEHRDEARMRHKDEVLIGPLPQANRLFPPVVLANDQRADALSHQPVHDATTGDMQIRSDLPRPFVSKDVELA